jgi:hypothetical protein
MPAVTHPFLRTLVRPLALLLAVFSLVFFLQVTAHVHPNGVDESACRLCQVAHIAVSPAIATVTLSVPMVSFGQITLSETAVHFELFFAQSPSRAPPSDLS